MLKSILAAATLVVTLAAFAVPASADGFRHHHRHGCWHCDHHHHHRHW